MGLSVSIWEADRAIQAGDSTIQAMTPINHDHEPSRPQHVPIAIRWRSGWKGRFNRQRLEAIWRSDRARHSSPQRASCNSWQVPSLADPGGGARWRVGMRRSSRPGGRHSLRRLSWAGALSWLPLGLQLRSSCPGNACLLAIRTARFSERGSNRAETEPRDQSPFQQSSAPGSMALVTAFTDQHAAAISTMRCRHGGIEAVNQ